MVPRITAVLTQFKTDWAAQLQPDAIKAACQEAGSTSWRDRVLTPVTTIQLFLLQVLHGNTACSHLPHLSGLRFSASAYCQARARLPLRCFDLLLERFGSAVHRSALDDGRWHGHRTFLVDGSGCSMPESAGPPGYLRPTVGAAARMRLPHGTTVGAVPCRHRGAPQANRYTPPHPRSCPGAQGAPDVSPRGCAGGGSRPVFLRASRPPRAGWRARRAPRQRTTDY
jgi:hypothetical protein